MQNTGAVKIHLKLARNSFQSYLNYKEKKLNDGIPVESSYSVK